MLKERGVCVWGQRRSQELQVWGATEAVPGRGWGRAARLAGPRPTCVPQAEGTQETHAVSQPRGQGKGSAERALAEEELELGLVLRAAGAQ